MSRIREKLRSALSSRKRSSRLKSEAHRREENGAYIGHIAYAGVTARKAV